VKGLSIAQLGLLVVLALTLLATFIAVVVEAWTLAAASAAISFGVFAILVVFTLAALTQSVQRQTALIRETSGRVHEAAAGIRRVDQRLTDRFRSLDSSEARQEVTGRRMLAAFEAHRQRVEDTVDEALQRKGQR
jgi:hypothetical protein